MSYSPTSEGRFAFVASLFDRALDAFAGTTDIKSDARRLRIRFLFVFCVSIAILFPLLAPQPAAIEGTVLSDIWHRTFLLITGALLLVLRIFKAEKLVANAFFLLLIAAIGCGAIAGGSSFQASLLTLTIVPMIMGLSAGSRSSLLGTVAVLGVFVTLALSESATPFIDYTFITAAIVCTIVSTLLFVYFNNSNERQTSALDEDNRRIRRESLTDALTGCYNRRAFQQAIERLIHNSAEGKRHGLYIIDLDRFKQINDTFGHDVGDEVLQDLAIRLKNVVGDRAQVFRLGGDEFAILKETVKQKAELCDMGDELVKAMEKPAQVSSGELPYSISIGVGLSNQSGDNVDQLYKQSDTAAFSAKTKSGTQYVFFDTKLEGATTRKFEIEQCLKISIQKKSIDLVFQPQVNLSDGSVLGYEALARWNDPLLGSITPAEFIPIAENSALIEHLDRLIFAKAVRQASIWLLRHQRISINVSARSLNSPRFSEFVLSQVDRCRLEPQQIEIEITETALIENWTTSKKIVEQLRAGGVRIVLDDFGVGYSSLSYLVEFPVQKIKFDRSFLQKSQEGPSALVMQAIAELAKRMNLELVAEGVETKDQIRLLRKIGCKTGQGYLIGKPMKGQKIASRRRAMAQAA
ncbi:MAG: EAL domain-containing protein [Pseudomonadota bacterium]